MRLAFFLFLASLASLVAADKWAVLICGSHTYENYRHHADIAHAYQLLTTAGIAADNIITFMYDDVANSPENPFPGQLFNEPTAPGTPGRDVYKGVKKDYTGSDVNAVNVMNVLTGKASAMSGIGSGRVLGSGPDDHVFINFVDHGGVGLLAMPNPPYWYSKDIISTLQTMNEQKMYKELWFSVEACESGSIFDGVLPANINVYANTAASPDQSSWGTYCPPQSMVDGKNLNTCLGDLYSVNWMNDVDKSGTSMAIESLYYEVKNQTTRSIVEQYGQMKIDVEPVSKFLGASTGRDSSRKQPSPPAGDSVLVDSRDATLHSMYTQYLSAAPFDRRALSHKLLDEMKSRVHFDDVFFALSESFFASRGLDVARHMTKIYPVTQHDCYEQAINAVESTCGTFTDYSLKYTAVTANMCEVTEGDVVSVVSAIFEHCG